MGHLWDSVAWITRNLGKGHMIKMLMAVTGEATVLVEVVGVFVVTVAAAEVEVGL